MQLVVARRWDQLGGRLTSMVNARSLAEWLGLEFRFVWPRGLDPAINDPADLFDAAFLATHELGPSALDGRPRVYHREFANVLELVTIGTVPAGSPGECLGELASAGPDAFLEVDEFFTVLQRPEETADEALARFQRCFAELGWSHTVQRLIEFCRSWPAGEPVAAIHVRAGDIVSGAWRYGIIHEKYVPTPYVHCALERLTGGGSAQVLVMSDNAPYLDWLRTRFPAIVTCEQVVPGYAELTPLQRALADILMLSRCHTIAAPPRSAFSMLGAYLGAGNIVRADTLAPEGEERDVLLAGIASRHQDAARSSLWAGLSARDICWCLEVFGETLSLEQRLELAKQAVRYEPSLTAATAQLARNAALAGDDRQALHAAADAVVAARGAERNDDPMLHALATKVAVGCFASIRAPGRRRRLLRGLPEVDLDELGAAYQSCLELEPVFIDRAKVCAALSPLLQIAREAARQPHETQRLLARQLRNANGHRLEPKPLEGGYIQSHRAAVMFDPLTGDLERMALQLELAGVAGPSAPAEAETAQ